MEGTGATRWTDGRETDVRQRTRHERRESETQRPSAHRTAHTDAQVSVRHAMGFMYDTPAISSFRTSRHESTAERACTECPRFFPCRRRGQVPKYVANKQPIHNECHVYQCLLCQPKRRAPSRLRETIACCSTLREIAGLQCCLWHSSRTQ